MPIPITRNELKRADAQWLLTLDYPGGEIRVSDKPATISSNDGEMVFVEGLKSIDLSILQDTQEISIQFVAEGVDFVQGLARGYVFERMAGQLSRYYEGTTFERRRIVSTGVLLNVSFGAPGKENTISGVLTQSAAELGENICKMTVQQSVMNEAVAVPGFLDVPSECPSIGLFVPIVIGYPGTPSQSPAVPALELSMTEDTVGDSQYPRWALAAHPIQATKCRIWTDRENNECDDSESGEFITLEELSVGQMVSARYSTIPFTNSEINTGGEFWFGLDDSNGGMLNPYRDGVLRGVSDVIRFLMSEVGRKRVDHSRFESYAHQLNAAFQIDTFINDGVTANEWLDDHILDGTFPIRMIEGPNGIYARRRTYRPEPWESIANLSTTGAAGTIRVARQSGLTPVDDPIYNNVTVKYAPHKAGANFAKWVEIRPDYYDFAGGYSNVFFQITHIAEVSANIFGVRPKVFELLDVWDSATASAIAVELLLRHAMPRYQILYQGGRELESLEIGDVVTISDSDLKLTERVATVEDVVFGKSVTQVLVEIRTDGLAFDASTS